MSKPGFDGVLTAPVIQQPSFNEPLLISAGLGLIRRNKQGDFDINVRSSPCKHTNPMLSLFLQPNLNCDQHLCLWSGGWHRGIDLLLKAGTNQPSELVVPLELCVGVKLICGRDNLCCPMGCLNGG